MTGEHAPLGIDVNTPNVARMYDYYLGGKDNFAADRESADKVLAAAPEVRATARENRAFLRRAVQFLAGQVGIRQFIDVGAGLPTQGSVHEVATELTPDAQVVYVDNDPVVLAHNRELLSGVDNADIVQADLYRPRDLLNERQVRDRIDFEQPVAVLMLLMLHFVSDDDEAAAITARFREAIPSGSYLVLSHGTAEGRPQEAAGQILQTYSKSSAALTSRTRSQIENVLLAGFELVEPGVVFLPQWRPDASARKAGEVWAYAAVGRKP